MKKTHCFMLGKIVSPDEWFYSSQVAHRVEFCALDTKVSFPINIYLGVAYPLGCNTVLY